jgi:hypothetical protein
MATEDISAVQDLTPARGVDRARKGRWRRAAQVCTNCKQMKVCTLLKDTGVLNLTCNSYDAISRSPFLIHALAAQPLWAALAAHPVLLTPVSNGSQSAGQAQALRDPFYLLI